MRVPAEWLICSAFLLSTTGCGSTKHNADTDAGDNDAATAAQAGKGSTSTGGNHASAGTGTSSSAGNSGGNNPQAGDGATSEDDAGLNTGSSGSGAAGQSGGAAGSTATTLPNDGNQLALCTMAQGDCNKGFACYSPATAFSAGRGFCSKICTMQSDCDGLPPTDTKYTCPTTGGTKVCQASCTGTDDTSCPSGMTCQETAAATGGMDMGMGMGGGGNGGSGGTKAVFHCKYPLEASPTWGECGDGTHACDKDLTCQGRTPGRSGYCSQSCDMDSDCSKPSTGNAKPTCVEIVPARGMMTKAVKACGLSCADAKDGCPDGETCVDGPKDKDGKVAYSRCEF